MANKKQLELIKKDVKAWNNWRDKNPVTSIDLSESNLGTRTLTTSISIMQI